MPRAASLLVVALALHSGCAGRVIRLENRLLRGENERLLQRNHELEAMVPDPRDFVREPTLRDVAEWLDRAGYIHEWTNDDRVLRLQYDGRNTRFGVSIQHFDKAGVLFLATNDYLRLDDAPDARGVVLLLVKLAALNYELLLGKLQLDPESGEIVFSTEIVLGDGLGYETFIRTLDRLTREADDQYRELSQAAGGRGL